MNAPRRCSSVIATVLGIGAMSLASGCTTGPPPPPPMSTAAQPCPQWAIYPLDIHSGQDSPYLGCTVEYNLRAMVANPADLDHGRTLGPADGERESRAIEAYRQGKVKPFEGSGASGATSSGSGASASASSGSTGR